MHLQSGTLLQGGKYRIEEVLGQGGFGITYLAVQTNLKNRKVAIKEFFLKEHCERDSSTSHVSMGTSGSRDLVYKFKAKFRKEAETISELENDHIIRINDVFEENGTAYYVMEYLSCGSLSDRIPSDGLPEFEALGYIRQVADALSYIHENKILHLDIKPSNILFRKADEAVLIDFGISKHYDESGGSQTSSTPVGISEGYAPTEQYEREGISSFSASTDIYSLGATLYCLLSGHRPPKASIVLNDGLPPLPSSVSASTRVAVETAMSPKRKDRPQSVDEFMSLLEQPEVPVEGDDTVVIGSDKEEAIKWIDVKEFCELYKMPMRQPSKKLFWILCILLVSLIISAVLVSESTDYELVFIICAIIGEVSLFSLFFYILVYFSRRQAWRTLKNVYDVEFQKILWRSKMRRFSNPFLVRNSDLFYGLYVINNSNWTISPIVSLLEIEYDLIIRVDDFSFICRKSNRYGLYRYGHKWALPLEFDMIELLPDNNLKATKGNNSYKYTFQGYRVVE